MIHDMMMTIFSLYLPILLSLSLSFLLHIFKKHVYSFFLRLVTTFKNSNINTIVSKNCHGPISSSPILTHAKGSPTSQIVFVDEEIGGGVDQLMMCCTESLGFESLDGMRVDDQIDKIEDHDDIDKGNNNNNTSNDEDEDEDEEGKGCCEGRRDYWRELKKPFPPPLSSLNQKGQPSFALVPVRENGRLQLNKVRIKRPEILYASREDGRLRLFLVPDQCNDLEEEEEYEGEGEQEDEEIIEEELVEEEQEEPIVQSEEDIEEIIRYEKEEESVVGDWNFDNNEGFRRCHQVANQCHNHHHYHRYHHHHHHHNLHMYGVTIA